MSNPGHDELPPADELMFAYGTLKAGGKYHYLLEEMGAELIGKGQLVIPYPLILAEYPCLLDQPGSGLGVKGEVYRIPRSEDWKKLDWLEDHPREYKRRPEPVWVQGKRMFAWTYFYREVDKLDPEVMPVEEYPLD